MKLLRPAPALLIQLAYVASSYAQEPDWASQVSSLRKSEQLVAASIATRDRDEMLRQSNVVKMLFEWVAHQAPKREKPECGYAVAVLSEYVSYMFGEDTAQRYLLREESLSDYRGSIAECEKQLNLQAPPKPNLR